MYSDAPLYWPPNMPKPRVQILIVSAHVDSDHSGDTFTRISRTGLFIYNNNALVYWIPKKQISIDASSFGCEFVATKAWTEYIQGLKLNLQMMGIQCDWPALIYIDNQSILSLDAEE